MPSRNRRTPPCGPSPVVVLALVLAGALGCAAGLRAEEPAPCQLAAASEAYKVGRFDDALADLERCLAARIAVDQQIEVRALLAKVYLATDRFDAAEEAIAALLLLNPHFTPATGDPPQFVRRLNAAKQAVGTTAMVTSVSKSPESLREAPATVVVVTGEEIARRGYLDLEAVLHDLPGFDISRGRGVTYSSLYQRGYRAPNDRTLFLVDGVEENDLWQGIAYLSRQFPLSDVDRIEVVYGPASTMYGPNAFLGVINVITKDPEALLVEGRRLAVRARAGAGSWNTRYADATLAGRSRSNSVRWSLTGRVYRSDEMDLSRFGDWDYDPTAYDALYAAGRYFAVLGLSPEVPADVALAQRARDSDKAALAQRVEGRPVGYSDLTDDWYLYGKVRLANLTLGVESWGRKEGDNSWYTDGFYPGADNGSVWSPEQTFAYLKYDRDLPGNLALDVFASFVNHRLGSGTREEQLRSYASGRLTLDDLRAGVDSFWRRTIFDESSRQVRGGVTLAYGRSPRFSLVGGVEVRNGLIQGDYILTIDCPDRPGGVCPGGERENRRDSAGMFFNQTDLGVFAQAAVRLRPNWRLVAGGRLDYDTVGAVGGTVEFPVLQPDGSLRIFRPEGYGTVFNPRLALVYSRPRTVFKAIYAEAFKDASNFNRYATSPGFRDLPNPSLEPEKVRSVELAAGWQPSGALSADLALYRSLYSNAVSPRPATLPDGTATLQNQAVGEQEISGLQATARWRLGAAELQANYTYTDPRNTNAAGGEVRIADIARHRLNLLADADLGERWRASLRLNWVGERDAGPGTSVANPQGPVPSYFVAGAAFTLAPPALRGGRLQLLVNNLLDARYDDPGTGSADGAVSAARLPQNERSVFLRLAYDF
jgi:outer membrane receptor protein involved in Fe transport